MPDHIHLFAAPGIPELELRAWIRYWKSQFSKRHGNRAHRWQTDGWDTRLRRSDSYDEKWEYVSNNPVRHSLVANADDWPFQGVLFDLRW
jgi:REP element-mobilizing transposase RayT